MGSSLTLAQLMVTSHELINSAAILSASEKHGHTFPLHASSDEQDSIN